LHYANVYAFPTKIMHRYSTAATAHSAADLA